MNSPKISSTTTSILNVNVIVSALGYFVDIYDLLLFGIVRVASLKDLGVPQDQLLPKGIFLINAQMIGMLLGGLLWGVLGDKRGRISVLFGSIALYSVANIANAFVTDVTSYGILRFIAGVGLAGELGAAITLVSETMSKEHRGYGTTVVAAIGILGAVLAALVADNFHWTTAYIIGGVMGLALLVLRVSMYESGMFKHIKDSTVAKGDLRMLFSPPKRFFKYLRCVLIGIPVWFAVGILFTFAPELALALGITDPITAGKAIMYGYIGLSAGDLASGFLSQYFKSRKKVVKSFVTLTFILTLVYVNAGNFDSTMFYALCCAIGFSVGYWAVFVTIAAEQFGTNLRATVATSVPNLVRGAVVPLTLSFRFLSNYTSLMNAALIVGCVSVAIALIAAHFMSETYGKDLDYLER